MQVANEIIRQLGGRRFSVMVGAKDFVFNDKTNVLAFRIGRNARSINYVTIELTAMDDYTVKFYRVRGIDLKLVEEFEGVYNANLVAVFESVTGLYTSL